MQTKRSLAARLGRLAPPLAVALYRDLRRRAKPARVDAADMPAEATEAIRQRIVGGVYLEFGAGHSTVVLAPSAALTVSVDNDRRYLRAVAAALGGRAAFRPVLCSFGLTAAWGRPAMRRPTARRRARWARYWTAPLEALDGRRPDAVLVDGRFRVACVLEALLRTDTSTTFFLDDFGARQKDYAAIMPFIAEPVLIADRMLRFRKADPFDAAAARAALALAATDWR